MGVRKKGAGVWPDGVITYAVRDTSDTAGAPAVSWTQGGIAAFNAKFDKPVFVPAAESADADVVFVHSSSGESGIGRIRRGQEVLYHRSEGEGAAQYKTLHHEMCHCVGLGHEQFHPDFPLRAQILEAVADSTWQAERQTLASMRSGDWQAVGGYDKDSVMMYAFASMLHADRVVFTDDVTAVTVWREPVTPPSTTTTTDPAPGSTTTDPAPTTTRDTSWLDRPAPQGTRTRSSSGGPARASGLEASKPVVSASAQRPEDPPKRRGSISSSRPSQTQEVRVADEKLQAVVKAPTALRPVGTGTLSAGDVRAVVTVLGRDT